MKNRIFFDYRKDKISIDDIILVETFTDSGRLVKIFGKVIAIYKYHCTVKTKHYITSVNFIEGGDSYVCNL